jgi:agmatinase
MNQGHGIEGRYLGASDDLASLETSKIVILPVPFDKTTTYQKGTNLGPAALIEASRNLEVYDTETKMEPHLLGIHTARPIEAKSSTEMLQEVYEVALSFLKQGKFVVALGGEHSITPALVRAHAEFFGPISVLQCDAHADLVPAYEGDPYSHASAMARVKEVEKVSHIVAVGIRSMSPEEKPFLDLSHTFFAESLHENEEWMDEVVEKLSDPVYLTFDLDVFDSSLMPSTGTPEPGGLFWHLTTKLLKKVAQKKRIVGFDVVELCPIAALKAPDFLAAKLVHKLLCYIMRQQ